MRRLAVLAISAILLLSSDLFAQEPGTIGRTFRLEARTGQVLQFEEAYKGHVDWHRQQNDGWNWDMWEYVAGPYTGQYVIVTGGHHWADFSRGQMGRADREHAVKHVSPHVEMMHSQFNRIHPELSSAVIGTPPPIVSVYTYTLKPGMMGSFLSALKKGHDALQKGGWNRRYMWVEVAEGSSDGDQFYVVVQRDGWKDFEEPEQSMLQVLEEQMGSSQAEAFASDFWSSVKSTQSHTLIYREDLSYRPQ